MEVTKISQMQAKNCVPVLESKLRTIEQGSSERETLRRMREELDGLESTALQKIDELNQLGDTIKQKKIEIDEFIRHGAKPQEQSSQLPFVGDIGLEKEAAPIEVSQIPEALCALELSDNMKRELVRAGCQSIDDVSALAESGRLKDLRWFSQISIDKLLLQLPKRERSELRQNESTARVRLLGFCDISPLAIPDSEWNAIILDNGDCSITFGSVDRQFSKNEFELVQ